jgi:hypothetical protein
MSDPVPYCSTCGAELESATSTCADCEGARKPLASSPIGRSQLFRLSGLQEAMRAAGNRDQGRPASDSESGAAR